MCLRLWVQGLEFRVEGLGIRVKDLGLTLSVKDQGLRGRDLGFRFQVNVSVRVWIDYGVYR